jgi:hypothetical protein
MTSSWAGVVRGYRTVVERWGCAALSFHFLSFGVYVFFPAVRRMALSLLLLLPLRTCLIAGD